MSINRNNAEGYSDPTTYEALTNIAKDEADKAEGGYLVTVLQMVWLRRLPAQRQERL